MIQSRWLTRARWNADTTVTNTFVAAASRGRRLNFDTAGPVRRIQYCRSLFVSSSGDHNSTSQKPSGEGRATEALATATGTVSDRRAGATNLFEARLGSHDQQSPEESAPLHI